MRYVRRSLLLITFVLGCGPRAPLSAPASPPAAPTPEQASSAEPAPPAGAPSPPPADSVDPLAALVDPAGHARIVVSEVRGARTYALVLHDLYAEANRALDAIPGGVDAWSEMQGECLDGDDLIRCAAAYAPHVGLLADLAADHAWSWSAVVIEGGSVVARRPLVALSLHDPRADGTTTPAMHVEDLDGDGRLELTVEVPVMPLRDDAPYTWGDEEEGAVTYLLDESLAVQARWTSLWSWGERMDDGDSPPRSEVCSASESVEADGSLSLSQTCGRDREVRCPYDAARDRYGCPARFADELLAPWSRDMPHYVGESVEDLRRQLPTLGTDEAALRRRAAALQAEATESEAPPAAVPPVAVRPAPAAPTCRLVVQDPAPPLNVRAEPSTRAPVVGGLDNGTALVFAERRGRWARIEAPHAGWVWTENIGERCDP